MKDIDFIKYKNLSTEMKKKQISVGQLAEGMGITGDALKDKLSRKKSFYLEEAEYIRHTFFPDYTISYLFEELSKEK